MEDNPNVAQNNLDIQMQELIIRPLRAGCIQTLIIIDALDECKDDEPVSALLFLLSKHIGKVPNVKFFLTGQPEPQIHSGFHSKSLQPIIEEFELHSVEHCIVDKDIRLYFGTQLAEITKTQSDCDLPDGWPSSSELDILCTKAAGLFIYASTVVKFVTFKDHSPNERLADIISLPQRPSKKESLELTSSTPRSWSRHSATYQQMIWSSILTLGPFMFDPLPMNALSTLLRVSNISTSLHSLHSLLLVPKSRDRSIWIFHKSFLDFLTDPERCKVERFFINSSIHHQQVLLSCLSLMKERLKKNICNLDDYISLDQVEDLSGCCKVQIGDALGYACQFWVNHLIGVPNSGHGVEEVHKAINNFFPTYFLLWIKVLAS